MGGVGVRGASIPVRLGERGNRVKDRHCRAHTHQSKFGSH